MHDKAIGYRHENADVIGVGSEMSAFELVDNIR